MDVLPTPKNQAKFVDNHYIEQLRQQIQIVEEENQIMEEQKTKELDEEKRLELEQEKAKERMLELRAL